MHNTTQKAAIALEPLTTHPDEWAEPSHKCYVYHTMVGAFCSSCIYVYRDLKEGINKFCQREAKSLLQRCALCVSASGGVSECIYEVSYGLLVIQWSVFMRCVMGC